MVDVHSKRIGVSVHTLACHPALIFKSIVQIGSHPKNTIILFKLLNRRISQAFSQVHSQRMIWEIEALLIFPQLSTDKVREPWLGTRYKISTSVIRTLVPRARLWIGLYRTEGIKGRHATIFRSARFQAITWILCLLQLSVRSRLRQMFRFWMTITLTIIRKVKLVQ